MILLFYHIPRFFATVFPFFFYKVQVFFRGKIVTAAPCAGERLCGKIGREKRRLLSEAAF